MIYNKKNKVGFLIKENKGGFTFIEMMLAVSIFSLIMLVISSVFLKTIDTRRKNEAIQRNMEDARVVIEGITKTLRTSTIISCNNDISGAACNSGNPTTLEFFDNSQGKCIQYKFDSTDYKIKMRNVEMDTEGSCKFSTSSSVYISMVSSDNYIKNISFKVIKADNTHVGRATLSMEVCSNYNHQGCQSQSDNFPIQTTVSIRK